ncbi:hypothetical protein HYDPIDRAFT_49158, partial [Hydnomerulius pinastri MD-312]
NVLNVVLFGETGVGKSSVVNLMKGETVADVSADVEACTTESTRYDITLDSIEYRVWDTMGLKEPQVGSNLKEPRSNSEDHLAVTQAYDLIRHLKSSDGIHLLVYCIDGHKDIPVSSTSPIRRHYKFIREGLCGSNVPLVLVITHLDSDQEREQWWKRNQEHFEGLGVRFVGHACISA